MGGNIMYSNKIDELEQQINRLPKGSISAKTINGKKYYYHRYTINSKRVEKYIPESDVESLKAQISERKILEAKLKELEKEEKNFKNKSDYSFNTLILIGQQLLNWAKITENYKKRDIFKQLENYIHSNIQDKVFVLFGLRRTGKTTMIRQMILEMDEKMLSQSVFIQITSRNTLFEINSDLKKLEKNGYKYIFIDEVTLMEDFIENAALFSDIYVSSGMKIILTGTDSLGFIFTKEQQLYDRAILLHTTFIPYREFENVLNIKGIDEYIQYGGTMSISGNNYNINSTFATNESTNEYVNTAIAKNIQHSLKFYQHEGHFRSLYDLYKNNELTSAINRVIEDINHRFTKDVLTKTFKSNDLSLVTNNLLRNKDESINLYENINKQQVINSIKTMLEILNKDEQTQTISDDQAYQIKEYLLLLDMIEEIDQYHFPNINKPNKKIVISQPGLRYGQVETLVSSLLLDEKFNNLSAIQRKIILENAMNTMKGQMMEDIVLLESKKAYANKQIFQLQFAVGEFDMVIYDDKNLTCDIFEIKHSNKIVAQQYQHLIDKEKCTQTEFRYGKITSKNVIYRGESTTVDDIRYINVEEYLNALIR